MTSEHIESSRRDGPPVVRKRFCSSLVVACLATLASCGGSSSPEPVPDPSAIESSSPPDTRFDPPCTDLEPDGSPVPIDDERLDTLQSLGEEPVVQVALPRVVSADSLSDRLRPRAFRIPGGMLVSINQFVDVDDSFGVLVAVNADGGIRWRRCLDPAPDTMAVGLGNDVDEFLVAWMTVAPGGSVTRRFEVWSLSEGRMTQTWDELLAANGVSGDAARYGRIHRLQDASMLVIGPSEERDIIASDSMLILDLSTWSIRRIPYPIDAIGTPLDLIDLGITVDGSLIELEYGSGVSGGLVRAVESSEGWSNDLDEMNASIGPRVEFLFGEEVSVLAGFDSQGRVIWRRDDVFDIQAEGFRVGMDSDVALVAACSGTSSGEVWCPGPKLLAVDIATGETLWQRDGRWAVSVFGDGHAIISGPHTDESIDAPPPWEMIDLVTGDRASETLWNSPWSFTVGCCDSPEEAWVEGGVVFSVDADSIELWYPKDLSTSLQRVAIDTGRQRNG
ncbi:MAG: hypothetical protein ACKOI2_13490 [Actinomycetota bacterium]